MDLEIKKLVYSLYQDDQHRKAIRLIIENCPTWRSLAEQIERRVYKLIKEKSSNHKLKEESFHVELYPKKEGIRCREIKLFPGYLGDDDHEPEGRGLWTAYILRTTDDRPDIGDEVEAIVASWCHTNREKQLFDEMKSNSPLPKTRHSFKDRDGWRVLWSAGTHCLIDFGEEDIEKCAELLFQALEKTYSPIRRWILNEK